MCATREECELWVTISLSSWRSDACFKKEERALSDGEDLRYELNLEMDRLETEFAGR